VNGKHRQAMFVLLHLIGRAAEFAGLLKGSKRFTRDVVKVRKPCGMPLSKWHGS